MKSWVCIWSWSDPRIVLWIVMFCFDFGLIGASTHTFIPFSIGCDRVALKVLYALVIYLTPWRLQRLTSRREHHEHSYDYD